MVTTTDSLTKHRKTEREELPVSPGFTDLPSFQRAAGLDGLAKEVRWARREMNSTMTALRERMTARHVGRFAMEKMRQAAVRPETQKKGIVVFSIVAFLAAAAVTVVPRMRAGRRRTKQT